MQIVFWRELSQRFERSVRDATAAGGSVERIVSEQHILNALRQERFANVSVEVLPRSQYVDGNYYIDEGVELHCVPSSQPEITARAACLTHRSPSNVA